MSSSPKKFHHGMYDRPSPRAPPGSGRETDRVLSMALTAKNHLGKLAENLHSMRETGSLCDFYLIAGPNRMPVHKVVMAASSDYFLSMLTSNMKESRANEVELKGVTSCALRVIVEFAYTGILKLNMDNVEEVLSGATHLQVNDAVKLCSRYIENSITPRNCVDILNLAELYSLSSTFHMARKFILENFENVALSEQYSLLTHVQLSQMLEENSLQVVSEFNLFDLVLVWINFNYEEREKYVQDLMKHVRLPLLSGEELVDKVSRVDIMKNNLDCLNLLTEAKDYHILTAKQPLHQNPNTQVRSNLSSLVMCHSNCLEAYAIEESPRHTKGILKDPIAPLYNPSVVVVDNFMYVCGGKYDNQPNNEIATARCFRYDPRFDTWFELASMNEPRRDFCLLGLNGYLYGIAGQDENKVMKSVECYSIATNEWERKPALKEQLYGHAGAVCENKIYICGGNVFAHTSKKMFSYSPGDDDWEEVASMTYPRVHHIMECVQEVLYAIGGSGNGGIIFPTFTPFIEAFNPRTNQWTMCKPTLNVVDAGSCVHEDHICIVGGALNDGVACFDTDKDELSSLDIYNSTAILSGKSCCILKLSHYL